MYRSGPPAAKQTAIVIVHYCQAKLTLRCLNSIFTHCQGEYTIYLVDNASPDGSLATIRKQVQDPRLVCLPQTENLGFGVGVNQGVEAALQDGAEAVLLLNNDAWVEHDILRPLLANSQANQDRALLSGEIRTPEGTLWYGGGQFSLWNIRVQHILKAVSKPRKTRFMTGCYLWIPAGVWRKLKGFDTRYFLYLEDLDLSLRAFQQGIPMLLLPGIAIKHVGSASTGGRNSLISVYYQNRNRFLVAQEHATRTQRFFFYFYYALGFCKRVLTGRTSRTASLWALKDALAKSWGKRIGM